MERCHNCVYYKPDKNNYFSGMCCVGTERKEYTRYNSHCCRWITNKNKYNQDLIGENNADDGTDQD